MTENPSWYWIKVKNVFIEFQQGIFGNSVEDGIEYETKSIRDFGDSSRLLCMWLIAEEAAKF